MLDGPCTDGPASLMPSPELPIVGEGLSACYGVTMDWVVWFGYEGDRKEC